MMDAAEFDDVIGWARGPRPAAVTAKARLLLLDSLGCIAAGLGHAEVVRLGAGLGGWLGPVGGRAAQYAAAMCWDEANEGLAQAHGRPGLAVVPVLLARAGEVPVGRLIDALVVGYEVGGRAGEVWRIRPGMHVDGSWHALGAAAACAVLDGADAARAVRIAACQIPFSLYRPLAHGMTGRNTYPAHAVLLGMLAAAASAAGSDAPAGGLAEARGLALAAEAPVVRTAAGAWLISQAYIKPYAGVRHAHYAAAAAIGLRGQGVRAADVLGLRLEIYGEALRYAGNRAPKAAISAQFSLSYATAAALLTGDLGPEAYGLLADPALLRLEAMVELAEAAEFTAAGVRAARLVARTAAGEVVAEARDVAGDPALPMSEAAVRAKFHRYAGHLPQAAALEAWALADGAWPGLG